MWLWGVFVLGPLFIPYFSEQLATAAEPVRLEVLPSQLVLDGPAAESGLLVTAIDAAGLATDVTSQATFASENESLAKSVGVGRLQALADGETSLRITLASLTVTVPVRIQNTGAHLPPSFRNDVVPVLTRYGCNQGSCHGKQAGQNGFRLSLRGYAPELDHDWITREAFGRRISLTTPADSLMVRKPAGQMPHAGGRLFPPHSSAAQVLKNWIAAGAAGLPTGEALAQEETITRLEVFPRQRQMRVGETQQLLVLAHYSTGRVRDVTWLAQIFSNDLSLLEVSPTGTVKSLREGESVVRVHFQNQVEVASFTIPFEQAVESSRYATRNNVIDEHLFNKLQALHIPPAGLCDDLTFLRRAMLATIGTLPTPDEVVAFQADSRSDKRAQLVEQLLERPEFIDYWALVLGDQLQNRKERDHDVRGAKSLRAMHAWLRTQLAANRPWNELAQDILTATGDDRQKPQIGYYIVTIGENRRAEETDVVAAAAQSFLGTRIGCAKCHNHPLERYTQDDYYHFAAYFARVGFERQESHKGPTQLVLGTEEEQNIGREIRQREKELAELTAKAEGKSGDEAEQLKKQAEEKRQQIAGSQKHLAEVQARPLTVRQPRTGMNMVPQPLDRTSTPITSTEDPRAVLARWIVDPTNEQFSGNMVNRLWKHFFAVGLVEPVDDLRASNPPTNRELWKALKEDFVAHKYDLKHLMRLILNSRAYQLSAASEPGNATETKFYSHYYARRLPAEVLLDAVSQSTQTPDEFVGYPVGTRAIQVGDPSVKSYFLSLFGRSDRVTACACERSGDVTLPQLLNLQSGDDLVAKLGGNDSRLKQLLAANLDDTKLLEQIFLATLSRPPTAAELASVTASLAGNENREEAFRDLFWALLNTKEFAFNH